MIPERYGWKGTIGILTPSIGSAIMREWNSVLPEGMACHQAIMGIAETTPDGLKEMRNNAVAEAKKLAAPGVIDLIFYACTSGSFIGGAGYDQVIIKDLEEATGVPSNTAATCVLTAFADLGIKRIALIGPYIKEVFDIEIQFFKDHGIETACHHGLGYSDPKKIVGLSQQPYHYYHPAKEAHRAAPDVDAVFITSISAAALKVIDTLEQELEKPVISSCSASLYGVLKQMGIREPVAGYGRLLTMLK